MEKRVIPFSPPDITNLEINEVITAMKGRWITTNSDLKNRLLLGFKAITETVFQDVSA